MLLSLLILPLIGVFLSFKPNSYYNNYYMNVIRGKNVSYYDFEKKNGYDDKGIYLKNVTLIITSLNLLISLVIFGLFNYNPSEFQFVQEHYNVSNFDIYLGTVWCEISLLLCLLLFNSGNILKFLMPSSNLIFTSRWINYSCMAISQKIMETVMGYPGSKSIIFLLTKWNVIVKEQRVYSSCYINIMRLKYTLRDLEINYQIRIFPNQVNKQVRLFYSNAIRNLPKCKLST